MPLCTFVCNDPQWESASTTSGQGPWFHEFSFPEREKIVIPWSNVRLLRALTVIQQVQGPAGMKSADLPAIQLNTTWGDCYRRCFSDEKERDDKLAELQARWENYLRTGTTV